MHGRGFAKIADILPNILNKIGLKEKLKEREILACWESVVGEEIAEKAEPVKVADGVLYVHVEHGAWMQELRYMEKEILAGLRKKVPGIELRKIRFQSMKRRPR
jgi:predicted nucleic acid-binding Zn ribbon protein